MILKNWSYDKEFNICLLIAFILHIIFLLVIFLKPHILINDIPYKTVRVKIGIETANNNNKEIVQQYFTQEEIIEQPKERIAEVKKEVVQDNKPFKKKQSKNKSNEVASKKNPMLMQSSLPQESKIQKIAKKNEVINHGKKFGNSNDSIVTVQNYEKILSSWILQYKKYTRDFKKNGYDVVGEINISIDRAGKIQDFSIEKTTGYNILDEAMIEMIKMANPVPMPPKNYPGEDILYFLIPVRFYAD